MVLGANSEEHNQHQLEHEIRSMISTLTHHLTNLGKSRAGYDSNREEVEEVDHGVRIITLAGDNKGAIMKGDLDEMLDRNHEVLYGDDKTLSAYTNSNYQAVNNSIMIGGGCTAEDPGVHLVISDYVEDHEDDDREEHGKKEKKKDKDKDKKKREAPKESSEKL